MKMNSGRRRLVVAGLLAAACGHARAEDEPYPANRPIRLLVGFPAGGGADTLARILAPRLAERLGVPVVIENRPGAGGNIAYETLAQAKPDGYTILLTTPTVTVNPSLYSRLRFDPFRDFAPIARLATGPYLLGVHAALPVRTVGDLIALAKKEPGKLNYASSGNGGASHLASVLLARATNIDVVHVPHKGNPAALLSVANGDTQFVFGAPSTVKPLIDSGKVRAIAVSSAARSSFFPDLPAVAETVPGFETSAWYAMLGRAGTPAAIIDRLNRELTAVLDAPALRAALAREYFEPAVESAAGLAAMMRRETDMWRAVIRQTGMTLD